MCNINNNKDKENNSHPLYFRFVPETAKDTIKDYVGYDTVLSRIYNSKKCVICNHEFHDSNSIALHLNWTFKDNIQSLFNIIPVCRECYAVMNMNKDKYKKDARFLITYYAKVNNISVDTAINEFTIAINRYNKASQIRWKLDEESIINCIQKIINFGANFNDPICDKYYSEVLTNENKTAKKFGALWDQYHRFWYFLTKEKRDKWLEKRKELRGEKTKPECPVISIDEVFGARGY